MPRDTHASRAPGFTLVELLVVLAVVGLLIGLLIPVIGHIRDTAGAARCAGNLRTLHSAAMLAIADRKNGMLDRSNWPTQISGYLALPPGHTGDDNWPENLPSPYRCEASYRLRPSDRGYTRTYGINNFVCPTANGGDTVLSNTARRLGDVASPALTAFFMDGAVGVAGKAYWPYVRPSNLSGASPVLYPHDNAANVVFVDGHVSRISQSGMLSKNGTEASPFWGKVR